MTMMMHKKSKEVIDVLAVLGESAGLVRIVGNDSDGNIKIWKAHECQVIPGVGAPASPDPNYQMNVDSKPLKENIDNLKNGPFNPPQSDTNDADEQAFEDLSKNPRLQNNKNKGGR